MGNRIPHNRPEHEQHHGYHHDTKVKPEAATAVVELLMMGVRTPETRRANWNNKLIYIVRLVGYFRSLTLTLLTWRI